MAEQVIIEFVGDSTKFEEAYHRIEGAVKEGTQLSQESLQQFQKANADAAASSDKLAGSAKTVSDSFRDMNKIVASGAMKEVAKDMEAYIGKVAELQAKQQAAAERLQAVNKELKELEKAGKKGTISLSEQAAKTKTLTAEQKTLTKSVVDFGTKAMKALGDAAKHTGSHAKATKKLKEEQKSLSTQMQQLSEKSGKAMTGLSKGLKNTSEAVGHVKTALYMAGVESDTFEKITGKLNTAISLTNSLGETGTKISEALAARKKAEAVAREANAAATGTEATTEGGATVAKTASTAAQWLLNAAMAANPILLIVSGVAALVVGLKALFSWTDSNTEVQKKKNAVDAAAMEATKRRMEIEKESSDEAIRSSEERVEKLKAEKAPVEEIRKAEMDLANERVKSAKKQEEVLGKQLEDFKAHKEERIQQQRELNDKIRQLQEDLAKGGDDEDVKKQLEVTKQQYDNLTESIKTCGDAIKETSEATSKVELLNIEQTQQKEEERIKGAVAGFRLKAAKAVEGSKEELEANIAVLRAEAAEEKKALDGEANAGAQRALIDAETNKKIAEMRSQFRIKNLEEAKAAFDEEHKRAEEGSQEELQMKLKDLEFEANIEKEKVGNAVNREEKIKQIEEGLRADQLKLNQDYENKLKSEADANAIAIAQSRLNVAKRNSLEEYNAKLALIKAQYDAEVDEANASIKNEQVRAAKLKELEVERIAQVKAVKDAANMQAVDAEQKQLNDSETRAKIRLEQILSDVRVSKEEKIKAQKEYDEVVEASADKQRAIYQQMYDKGLMSLEDFTKKAEQLDDAKTQREIANSNKAAAEKKKNEQAVAQAAIKVAQQASDAIFAAENAARNAKFNSQISALEKQSAAELNNHNLTAAQKAAIEKKFHQQEAAIKLKQWKADQKSKEIQAGINGALAIANILATMPWSDFGVGQAIAIAMCVATTAIQVATIASAKPPQFAKGTPKGMPDAPPGLIWVGEKGPELMYNKGAARVITNADSMQLMQKYDIPAMPNFSTTLSSSAVDEGLRRLNETQYSTSTAINYDKLGQVIAEKLKANPQTHLHFDKTGFTMHLVKQGNKVTTLNNRYSSPL